jgi:hypothetical protein
MPSSSKAAGCHLAPTINGPPTARDHVKYLRPAKGGAGIRHYPLLRGHGIAGIAGIAGEVGSAVTKRAPGET